MIPGRRRSLARRRVHVLTTELLAAFEAPGFPTAVADQEAGAARCETTGKNIVASVVLQAPSFAPGALLGVHSTLLLHHHIQAPLHSRIRGAQATHPRTGSYSLLRID